MEGEWQGIGTAWIVWPAESTWGGVFAREAAAWAK